MGDRLPSLQGLRDAGLEPLYRAAIAVAALAGLVVFLSTPLLNLLASFGVPVSPEQIEAINGVLVALAALGGPVAVAAAARPQVTSPATVEDILTGPGGEAAGAGAEAK